MGIVHYTVNRQHTLSYSCALLPLYLSPVQYTQRALTQQLTSAYCIHYTGKKQLAILNSIYVHVSSIYLFSFFYPPSLPSLFCIYLFQYYWIKTEPPLQHFCEQVNK